MSLTITAAKKQNKRKRKKQALYFISLQKILWLFQLCQRRQSPFFQHPSQRRETSCTRMRPKYVKDMVRRITRPGQGVESNDEKLEVDVDLQRQILREIKDICDYEKELDFDEILEINRGRGFTYDFSAMEQFFQGTKQLISKWTDESMLRLDFH